MNRKLWITTIVCLVFVSSLVGQKRADELKGLQIGAKAPYFEALNSQGENIKLNDELNKGPVVLVFYRGEWCPVCNKHLKTLQDSLEQIGNLGATVFAISPQKPEYLKEMAKKTNVSFSLLFDKDYAIMKAFDVAFTPKASTAGMYNLVLGAKLKESQSDESQRLPVPATFIINTDGRIAWRHFDPDYKERSSVKEIKEALVKLTVR